MKHGTQIGKGSFGKVYILPSKGGVDQALKLVDKPDNAIHGVQLVREIRALKGFHHPNILRLIRAYEYSPTKVAIVTDLALCTLRRVIHTACPSQRRHIIAQMLSALQHIHVNGWVHCDVKPDNIFLLKDSTAILGDLGMLQPVGRIGLTDYLVTRWYRPPEIVFKHSLLTGAVDIWSLGCVWLQLLRNGESAFCACSSAKLSAMMWEAFGLPKAVWCYELLCSHVDEERFDAWLTDRAVRGDSSSHKSSPECSTAAELVFIRTMMSFDYRKRPTAGILLERVVNLLCWHMYDGHPICCEQALSSPPIVDVEEDAWQPSLYEEVADAASDVILDVHMSDV